MTSKFLLYDHGFKQHLNSKMASRSFVSCCTSIGSFCGGCTPFALNVNNLKTFLL